MLQAEHHPSGLFLRLSSVACTDHVVLALVLSMIL
jgi:hypothetical protein